MADDFPPLLGAPAGVKKFDCVIREADARGRPQRSDLALTNVQRSHDVAFTRAAKQANYVAAIETSIAPAATTSAAIYNHIKELFELGNAALAAAGLEIVFGGIEVGGASSLKRPGGTSLPARVAELTQSSFPVSAANWLAAFNNANSTEGITWASNTNNCAAITGNLNASTLHGLFAFGTDDPSEAGAVPGTAHEVSTPIVAGEYLFAPSVTAVILKDWMRHFANFARTIAIELGYKVPTLTIPGEFSWETILPAPTGVSASAGASSGELDVTWTGPNPYWGDEKDASFAVYYGLASGDVSNRFTRVSGSQSSPYTITGLLPGQTYFVAVALEKLVRSSDFSVSDPTPIHYVDAVLNSSPGILSTIVSGTSGA